jgi:hypothetical protein
MDAGLELYGGGAEFFWLPAKTAMTILAYSTRRVVYGLE